MISNHRTGIVWRNPSADPSHAPDDRRVANPDSDTSFDCALVTRLIEDETAFENLEHSWSALAASCGVRPFQELGWARAWIQTIGRCDGRKLRIGTLWQGAQLVAILPLVRRSCSGVRLLEWIGARVTDYCDALVRPDVDSPRALALLWDSVIARGDCDVVRLGQIRDDATIHGLFVGSRLHPWMETREYSYSLPIRCTDSEQWLLCRGAHARKQTRYDLRRLAKAGFEYYVWSSPEPYEALTEALIAQKSAWLTQKGLGTLMGHARGADFLRKCIAEMAAAGSLHLSAFRSEQGFAACHLGFYHRGILYGYMPTYDPRWAAYSPGAAIRDAFVMWACDHGVQKVDLLRGAHDFKLQYRPEPQGMQTLVLPVSLIGRACLAAYKQLA